MRILFFINHLADGGAERVAATLLDHLCENHDVELVLFSDKQASYNINPRIPTQKIIVSGNNKIIKVIRRVSKIRELIKETNPDLIISFMVDLNMQVLLANCLTSNKLIISEQTTIQRRQTISRKFTRHFLYKIASKVVFASKSDCDYAKWLRNKTFIFNPLSHDIIKGDFQRENTIVAISSQHRWQVKGFDLLIEAWAKIAQSHSTWNLQFIGLNNDNYISNLVKSLGLEKRVDFLGWYDDIDKVLQTKSICVLSSRHEGFPCSLLEAMSQGCACVAFDCKTGPNEIICDGKSGLLARNGNIDDLANKLEMLINDEQLRLRLAAGAIKEVKRFDKNVFFAQWNKLIEEVTER
ncbi:MAG: glycosyltransferase [Salinivirgaceae bacterium]|nr:glycosyltransferase [Salinivirgaceae bacterium]